MTDPHVVDRWSEPALQRELALGRYRRINGIGRVVAVLIGVTTVLSAVSTWTSWHGYQVAHDYVFGSGVTDDDLDRADRLSQTFGVVYLIAILATAVGFVMWLWRARHNAELLCVARHRRSRGWIIGSWLCPVVNLWFPYMIVDDVYRASRPDRPYDLFDLRTVPGSRLLGWWWASWLAAFIADRFLVGVYREPITIESLRSAAIAETVGSGLMAGAAVLIIMIVRQISGWQTPVKRM